MRSEVAGLEWSAGRIIPKFQSVSQLDVYDVRGASRDEQITATIVAGLVNRPQPRIYLLATDDDLFWLQQAFSAMPHTISTHTGSAALRAMLSTYRSVIQGMIIYNPALPDTINVATTMAGQQDCIIVSPELADELKSACQLPVLDDLRKYAWRDRLEIYQWAQRHLLPKSSARIIAGLIQKHLRGSGRFWWRRGRLSTGSTLVCIGLISLLVYFLSAFCYDRYWLATPQVLCIWVGLFMSKVACLSPLTSVC